MRSVMQWIIGGLILLATAFLATNKRYRWIYIIAKTYRRDMRGIIAYTRLCLMLWWLEKQNKTVAAVLSDFAKKHPQKEAVLFENDVWTFAQVESFTNKVARYFKSQGYGKGDTIALILENRPEYLCLWLGLSKIGVVTALINTNLISDPLVHSINIAKCKALIFGSNHAEPVNNVLEKVTDLKLYQFHEMVDFAKDLIGNSADLRQDLDSVFNGPVEKDYKPTTKDPLIYIYTSGTTGLPKAAMVTNLRYMLVTWIMRFFAHFSPEDILYNPLPLYHTAGGMLAAGQMILSGNTVVVRKKFSASNYWTDCARYKCTVAHYIGEMCRYILAVPYKEPINHSVRAIAGNGLRPQIWKKYVDRFGIKEVFEIYGSTEGISNMINLDNTVGSVGFVPRYARKGYPVTVIKCDLITGDPIRSGNGRCIECDVDEPGLVIGKINPEKAAFSFKGYSDEKATDKKILQNVFEIGDMYFNSGDIMMYDEFGNYFFKDRTGDTFRWKGENVSTTEVEAVISNTVSLGDAVVYGVEIPETEGRAGMAAVVDADKTLDVDTLCAGLRANLPGYSIPMFLRVMESIPMTGTYKMKKVDLQAEGYNVDKIKDDLYFFNSKLKKYEVLTKETYEKILNGKMSL